MKGRTMSKELYEAALKGDLNTFTNQHWVEEEIPRNSDEVDMYFLPHTAGEHNTILHVAAQNRKNSSFIEKLLQRYPTLLHQTNSKGDTTLHVCAKHGDKQTAQLLINFAAAKTGLITVKEPLWKVQNVQGETPLHVALKRGKIEVALLLVNLDDGLNLANKSKETPLHLATSLCTVDKGKDKIQKPKGGNLQEDLLCVIELLMKKANSPTSMRDANGLTPLLRASCCSNSAPVISIILSHDPQLAEQLDLNGRNMLHLMKLESYGEWKKVLEFPSVNALKDDQDFDGNTPLHLAVKYSDIMKVRVLMECSADFTIQNGEHGSAWDLIQAQSDFMRNLTDQTDQVMNGTMKKELYIAAREGKMDVLSQSDDNNLLSRSMDGNNILHIAMCPESVDRSDFVKKVIERFPLLLCQTNAKGDTPLHFGARSRTRAAFELMKSCEDTFQKASEMVGLCLYLPPWKVRNSEGNTPLHEALHARNALFAKFLIQLDDEVAWIVNNSNETPLHLCAKYKQEEAPLFGDTNWPEYSELRQVSEQGILLTANISATCMRDVDGFTPLLRAAQCNQIELVKRILCHCPHSARVYDLNGRNFLHLLPLINGWESFLEIPEVTPLISAQDYEGNTPLHVAIKNRHFSKVTTLVLKCSPRDLLLINNGAESTFDLIKSQTEVPDEIRKYFQRMSSRSLYGISEAAKQENVNTLLVIAVLLATITFAAAFTVPGGFNGNDGTPILLRKAAFKVFLISDTCAMCFSMLALFTLLWVMTGKTREFLKLMDFSIFVLQMSFYTTTLAFMAGVYVAIAPKTPWMAILVCILCSILMVSSLKPVVLFLSKVLPRVPDFLMAVAKGVCCLSNVCILCVQVCLCAVGSD